MSASKEPPHLPDVVDEAGESPGWVPLLGLGLLCLVALLVALNQAVGPSEPAAAAGADGGVAGAGAGEAGGGEAGGGEAPTVVPAAAKPTGDSPGHEGHGH